jgi:hypothetical protein
MDQAGIRTWVHPLHAVWKSICAGVFVVVDTERSIRNRRVCVGLGSVGVDVVSSPSWVDDNGMCSGERPSSGDEDELGKTKHGGGAMWETKAAAKRMSFSLSM